MRVAEQRAQRNELGTQWTGPWLARHLAPQLPDAELEWDDDLLGDDYSSTDYGPRDVLRALDELEPQDEQPVVLIIQLGDPHKKS